MAGAGAGAGTLAGVSEVPAVLVSDGPEVSKVFRVLDVFEILEISKVSEVSKVPEAGASVGAGSEAWVGAGAGLLELPMVLEVLWCLRCPWYLRCLRCPGCCESLTLSPSPRNQVSMKLLHCWIRSCHLKRVSVILCTA